MSKLIWWVAGVLMSSVALPAPAAAEEERERATLSLPVVVGEPAEPSRVYSFREGEFWGWQPAHYRSAVTLASPLFLPELGAAAAISTGERLVEVEASMREGKRSLYCTVRQPNLRVHGALLCLADRDGDGEMDQLWTGGAASMKFIVPFPNGRSLRSVAPVRVSRVEDPAGLALQLGFHMSGTNPIFGTHHFYPMLSKDGEVGFTFTQSKNSVTLRSLPKGLRVGGAELQVESAADKQYRARVVRPYPSGDRLLTGEVPKQTIYVSVPG